jgi:hypothetical protein
MPHLASSSLVYSGWAYEIDLISGPKPCTFWVSGF